MPTRSKHVVILLGAAVCVLLLGAVVVARQPPEKQDIILARLSRALNPLHGGHLQPSWSGILTPGSGEYVLPPQVQDMLALLRRHQISAFDVSEPVRAYRYGVLEQRIADSAYPAQLQDKAEFVFALTSEPPSACPEIDRQGEVRLDRCP